MARLRASEAILAVAALVIATMSLHAHRRAEYNAAVLSNRIDSLRRRSALLAHDVTYLRRWAQVTRASDSISLKGTWINGGTVSFDLSALPHALLIYSLNPACSSCFRNLPFISRVRSQSSCPVSVIGVLVASPKAVEAIRRERIGLPLITESSGPAWSVLPLSSSPSTTVIAPEGRLVGWWTGILSAADEQEISSALAATCNRKTY